MRDCKLGNTKHYTYVFILGHVRTVASTPCLEYSIVSTVKTSSGVISTSVSRYPSSVARGVAPPAARRTADEDDADPFVFLPLRLRGVVLGVYDMRNAEPNESRDATLPHDRIVDAAVWKIRDLCAWDFLFFDRRAALLASRSARAAGVNDAVLSTGVADNLDLELPTEDASPPFSFLPPFLQCCELPAERYVLARSDRPLPAFRAMLSLSVSSTTSNAGRDDASRSAPLFPTDMNADGRAGSQSAGPLPSTSGVDATSPHVIIGSSESAPPRLLLPPPPPGCINGVMATNVSCSA